MQDTVIWEKSQSKLCVIGKPEWQLSLGSLTTSTLQVLVSSQFDSRTTLSCASQVIHYRG